MNVKSQFDKKKFGYVFNIQNYSMHDGPGIRTMVFLKGCPLRCKWCSNPESQQCSPELAFKDNKCIGIQECGRCLSVCPNGAVGTAENGMIKISREACQACFVCADNCPAQSLHVFGKLRSINEVLRVVENDSAFYARSGGGMTISGGEPLMQAEFTTELLKEAKRRRINTAIETCGFVEWPVLQKAAEFIDTILFDIKCIDAVKHKQFTGGSNEVILSNFENLCQAFPKKPILVRTPVVPGFNDSLEDIRAIVDFIKGRDNVSYQILQYHRLGQPKYEYLGRQYPLGDVKLDDQLFKEMRALVQASGIKTSGN